MMRKALQKTKKHSEAAKSWGQRRTISVPKGADPNAIIKKEVIKVPGVDGIKGPTTPQNIKPIKDTRSTHSVRSVQPYVVSSRLLSCFCESCLLDGVDCQWTSLTGPWKVSNLKVKPRKPRGMFTV